MKHVFLVNPQSGKGHGLRILVPEIEKEARRAGVSFEIHQTRRARDAEETVRLLSQNTPESLRFYAVGGDGTLHQVVNGAMGSPHAEVAFIPSGMGNDFARMFDPSAYFQDISRQIHGTPVTIDVIRYNDRYSINVLNIGLDAAVAQKAEEYRSKTPLKNAQAYLAGIVSMLRTNPGYELQITVEDEASLQSNYTLTAIGNGAFCGGGFKALPRASLQDGLLDVIMVNKLKRRTLLPLLTHYRNGKHLEHPGIEAVLSYQQCTRLQITAERGLQVCADGELSPVDSLDIAVLPGKLRFSVPKGCRLI